MLKLGKLMCYVNRPSVEAKAEINNENKKIESKRVMFVGGWMSSPSSWEIWGCN